MMYPRYNKDVAINFALYLLNKDNHNCINVNKLMLMLYLTERKTLFEDSMYLTSDVWIKTNKGPIMLNLFNYLKDGHCEHIRFQLPDFFVANKVVDEDEFSINQMKLLDFIYKNCVEEGMDKLLQLTNFNKWTQDDFGKNITPEEMVDEEFQYHRAEILAYYYERLEIDKLFETRWN